MIEVQVVVSGDLLVTVSFGIEDSAQIIRLSRLEVSLHIEVTRSAGIVVTVNHIAVFIVDIAVGVAAIVRRIELVGAARGYRHLIDEILAVVIGNKLYLIRRIHTHGRLGSYKTTARAKSSTHHLTVAHINVV